MSDWRKVLFYAAEDRSRILNDRAEPIAVIVGQGRSEFLSFLLSRNRTPDYRVTDPSGEALFRFQYKTGDFRSWLKVMHADGSLIARIDRIGTRFTTFKSRFVVRGSSGEELGRIDNPVLGHEFVINDHAGTRMARGVRHGQSTWSVQRENVAEGFWPEIAAAFFLSITWLMRSPS
jgi:hypothetical protein